MNGQERQLESFKARINDLESSLGYLQRDFESQNEMILLDAKRINKLEKAVERLAGKIETMSNPESIRDLEDEKPPHY